MLFLTSKPSSSRFSALDGQIFKSVRRLGLIFRFFTVRTWGKARVTKIPEGGSAPPDPPGGKARITEIPEWGLRSPRPPHDNISKKKTSASTVVDSTFGRKKSFSTEKNFGRRKILW